MRFLINKNNTTRFLFLIESIVVKIGATVTVPFYLICIVPSALFRGIYEGFKKGWKI